MRPAPVLTAFMLCGCASTPPAFQSVADLSAAERSRLLITAADVAQRQACQVSLRPPPPLGELMDSAAVHAAIAARLPEMGTVAGRVLLSVRADSAGAAEWVRVLDPALPDPARGALAAAFRDRLRPRLVETDSGPRPRGWTHRIAVEHGPTPRITVGHPVTCRPEVRNRDLIMSRIQQQLAAARIPEEMRGRTALVWIFVGEEGLPRQIEVRRSTGYPQLDRIARNTAADLIFHPASIDGRPLAVWSAIPIRFERGPRRP